MITRESRACIENFLENESVRARIQFSDEVLENTPQRFLDAFRELMGANDEEWKFTTFESKVDEMVVVSDIPFVSLCEHHLLPMYGIVHVAYIPNGRVAGLSKIPRCVRSCSRGLWTQENLTVYIRAELESHLDPLGTAVVIRAEHTCMSIRGIKATGTKTKTSSMSGVFLDNQNNARAEFLSLVGGIR